MPTTSLVAYIHNWPHILAQHFLRKLVGNEQGNVQWQRACRKAKWKTPIATSALDGQSLHERWSSHLEVIDVLQGDVVDQVHRRRKS